MTVPHLMNCPHSDEGWCLDCVAELGNENWRMRELLNKRPALNAGTPLAAAPLERRVRRQSDTKGLKNA